MLTAGNEKCEVRIWTTTRNLGVMAFPRPSLNLRLGSYRGSTRIQGHECTGSASKETSLAGRVTQVAVHTDTVGWDLVGT